jgi:hypothetical protein
MRLVCAQVLCWAHTPLRFHGSMWVLDLRHPNGKRAYPATTQGQAAGRASSPYEGT